MNVHDRATPNHDQNKICNLRSSPADGTIAAHSPNRDFGFSRWQL